MDDDSYLCRNRNTPPIVRDRAKALRNAQTPAEEILWDRIRRNRIGYRFRRQHAISHVILDFYCPELRLGIEVDGGIHRQPDVRAKDLYKEELIENYGITLLRFTNDLIAVNIDLVVEKIRNAVRELEKRRDR